MEFLQNRAERRAARQNDRLVNPIDLLREKEAEIERQQCLHSMYVKAQSAVEQSCNHIPGRKASIGQKEILPTNIHPYQETGKAFALHLHKNDIQRNMDARTVSDGVTIYTESSIYVVETDVEELKKEHEIGPPLKVVAVLERNLDTKTGSRLYELRGGTSVLPFYTPRNQSELEGRVSEIIDFVSQVTHEEASSTMPDPRLV